MKIHFCVVWFHYWIHILNGCAIKCNISDSGLFVSFYNIKLCPILDVFAFILNIDIKEQVLNKNARRISMVKTEYCTCMCYMYILVLSLQSFYKVSETIV